MLSIFSQMFMTATRQDAQNNFPQHLRKEDEEYIKSSRAQRYYRSTHPRGRDGTV